jgi:hypothetical protein
MGCGATARIAVCGVGGLRESISVRGMVVGGKSEKETESHFEWVVGADILFPISDELRRVLSVRRT